MSWFPDRDEECLLRACLGEGSEAVAAFEEWTKVARMEDLAVGSYRLLPLLGHNLSRLGVQHPYVPRAKGVLRLMWTSNQLRLRLAERLIGLLEDDGIPTLMLKGVALVHGYYSNVGLRSMRDVDILVPRPHAQRAWDLFEGAGFHRTSPPGFPRSRAAVTSGVNLSNDQKDRVDLHWHVLSTSLKADEEFWNASRPLTVGSRSSRQLSPEHLLVHVLTHAAAFDEKRPLRWVADAVLILRRQPLNWEEVVRQARFRHLSLIVNACLRYLRDHRFWPIPDEVISSLEAVVSTRRERVDFQYRLRQDHALTGFAFHRFNYHRLSIERSLAERCLQFPAYLRDWWGVPSLWHVPIDGLRRFWHLSRGEQP